MNFVRKLNCVKIKETKFQFWFFPTTIQANFFHSTLWFDDNLNTSFLSFRIQEKKWNAGISVKRIVYMAFSLWVCVMFELCVKWFWMKEKKIKPTKMRFINTFPDTLAFILETRKADTHTITHNSLDTFHLNFHEMIIHQIASYIFFSGFTLLWFHTCMCLQMFPKSFIGRIIVFLSVQFFFVCVCVRTSALVLPKKVLLD